MNKRPLFIEDMKNEIKRNLLDSIQKTKYVSCTINEYYSVEVNILINNKPHIFRFHYEMMLSLLVNNNNDFDIKMVDIYHHHLHSHYLYSIERTIPVYSEQDYLRVFIYDLIRKDELISNELLKFRNILINDLNRDAVQAYEEIRFRKEMFNNIKTSGLSLNVMVKILKEEYNSILVKRIQES